MNARWSLQKRVGLAFALLGFLLSVGFALVTLFIAEDYEHILIDQLLETAAVGQLDGTNEGAPIKAYPSQIAPVAYRGLAPGIHEPELAEREGLHVGVFEKAGRRVVVVADVGEIEVLEVRLAWTMAAIVIVGTALAGWLGWLLSALAIRPVNRLAQRVVDLPVVPVATSLAEEFARDSLGAIARAIDGYQQRLVASDASERAFYADASHELRTPMTVAQGAIEIIADDPGVLSAHGVRLGRINRAMGELGLMLDALLLGARRPSPGEHRIQLDEIAGSAILRVADLDSSLSGRVRCASGPGSWTTAPRRWIEVLLNVLLLRLAIRYPDSFWEIRTSFDTLVFMQMLSDSGPVTTGSRADLGISLRFAERICGAIGWTLHVADESGGLVVTAGRSSSVRPED